MKLQKPWSPLTVTETAEGARLSVFGRTYTADSHSPLASIVSRGEEMLRAPLRFLLREDGEERVLCEGFSHFLMEGASEAEADLLSTVEGREFLLNLATHIEFDGCLDITLTVAPRGRSVAQCFGMEKMPTCDFRLDRLWVEIPLKREAARYFQFYPHFAKEGVLASGGELTAPMSLPYREQVFLTGEDRGLLFFCESEEGWEPLGRQNAIEILPEGDTVTLRVRLLDAEPRAWQTATGARIDLTPISFRLGLMATPVKPMPERLFEERAVHIDCYKKILEDYCDFLGSPFADTDEVTYDRLVRLGVNTLYIHEKWNDLQNSPRLTAATARRLRSIISECHARGIRVIPYFGYEMATLAPYCREMSRNVWRYAGAEGRAGWYRQPPQRNIRVCQKSDFSEFFTEGIDRLLEEYEFDGIYLDGTATVFPCENGEHGCGFTDEAGVRHATYPVWGTRKTLKRLAEIVCEKHGGIINCHAGSSFNLPALAFTTSLWDGEIFQTGFLHGRINALPDAYFRALYTGRNIGIPIFLLTYLNPPVWDFRMALSTALPFGILPKVNDAGEPLEVISRIWAAFDRFGVEEAEFTPYYRGAHPVAADDLRVKVSVWQREGRLLAVIASTERELSADVTLTFPYPHLRDAESGMPLSENGSVTLPLRGFSFRLIEASK